MPHLLTTEIDCPEGVECEQCSHHFVCWHYDMKEIEDRLIEKFETSNPSVISTEGEGQATACKKELKIIEKE